MIKQLSPTATKLISKGGEIAGAAIGAAIGTRKTDLDKRNLAEIEELRRKEELDMLGLSEEERALLASTYGAQLRSIGEEGERRRRQQMAAQDLFGGAALQQAALTDQALAEANIKAAAAITEADLTRAARQEEELIKREQIESERLKGRRRIAGEIVSSAISQLATIPSEKIEEEGQFDPILIDQFQKKYNISNKKDAISILKSLKSDPDMASILLGTL